VVVDMSGSLVHMETLEDVEEDVFYFDPAPVDQDVLEGGEARLRCDVSSRRMIVFYWTLNDKPVTNTSRRYQDDSDLRVVRADRHLDDGSFRCVATNVTTGIALRSAEARLNIFCECSSTSALSSNLSDSCNRHIIQCIGREVVKPYSTQLILPMFDLMFLSGWKCLVCNEVVITVFKLMSSWRCLR